MNRLSKLLFVTILGFLIVIPNSLMAGHLMGGSISYSCITPCTYRITQKIYQYCTGNMPPGPPIPSNPFVTFTGNPPNCTVPVPLNSWTLVHYIQVTPVCPSVTIGCPTPFGPVASFMEAIYHRDYDFCPVGGCMQVDVIWDNCCRNPAISSGAAAKGIHFEASIDLSVSPCNSSPQFVNQPAIMLCVGTEMAFSQCAYDPDGDSLVYSLTACKDGKTSIVPYSTGFSPASPLGPSWQVSLDSVTGDLRFVPNPGGLVVGVVCIMVSEYRNGIKIGEVTQDINVHAENVCSLAFMPHIDSLMQVNGGKKVGPWEIEACNGIPLSFQIAASDMSSADTLAMYLNCQLPGASITYTGVNPIIGTVTWTPPKGGTFPFSVLVKDNQCPLPISNTQKITITVDPICIDGAITHTMCGHSNGAIDITVIGAALPISYLWSTGDTTEDLSGLQPGSYSLTATDANGVVRSKTFYVNASDLVLTSHITQPTCNNLVDGQIVVSVKGGNAPYTYSWNTGATTDSIGGLSPGGYAVNIVDAQGCPTRAVFILQQPDSCFNIIEGVVYDDANGNCVQDVGEAGLPNILVDLTPGGVVFTDANGGYKFRADSGNVSVTIGAQPYYQVNCPISKKYDFQFQGFHHSSTGNDFSLNFLVIQDLQARYFPVRAVPGFDQLHYLSAKNNGSTPISGTLVWMHDPIFDFKSSSLLPAIYNPATREAQWTFSNLLPGYTFRVVTRTHVDSTVALGTWWDNFVEALPILGDTTPGDNHVMVHDTTRGSFDPNDKVVAPRGIRTPGYILASDEPMDYHIRFQNTGTDTAYFVVIRDTLDDDLDYLTLQPTGASHPYSVKIEDDKVLVFTFAHIYLPDSTTDYIGSQGFASFRIKQKPNLPAGTELRNSAAIFFDFNAPIITNEVLNTIYTQPVVSAGSDTTFCGDGDISALITAAGMPPYDFSWSHGPVDPGNSTGMTSTNVAVSGMYHVNVTDAFGFTTDDSVQVTALPLPDATFQAAINFLAVDFTNTSPSNTSWAWDFGDGNGSSGQGTVSHSYALPGMYTATLIVSNDCGADTVTQTIDVQVNGLADDAFARSVRFTPNPMTQQALLTFDNPSSHLFTLQLYDMKGRVVMAQKPTRGGVFEVNRGDLVAGVYVYTLSGGGQNYVGRMMVR